jgi:hypothetical protein
MLDKNVKAYLSAIDAAAIYVLTENEKPACIGACKNLDLVTRKLAGRKFGWIAWGKNYQDLEQICRFKNINLLLQKNLEECVEAITQIAESRKVVLTNHDVVMQRATFLAGKIKNQFNDLRKNGDLYMFNKAYHAYRIAEKRNGRSVEPYYGIMDRFRRIIIHALIEEKDYDAIQEILHREFPWLSKYGVPTDNGLNH